jgi:plasmid stabilization system protein ParE
MAEIRWTLQAADDLEAIVEFIADDSPHYASLFALDVLTAVEKLASFPTLGRGVPEAHDPTIREIILAAYRIVYRTVGSGVEILTVFHGAKSFDLTRLSP